MALARIPASIAPDGRRMTGSPRLMKPLSTVLHARRLARLAVPTLLALGDPAAHARGFTEPSAIDRAVAAFTGAAIGAPGGARTAADPRLRLAACEGTLGVSWHTAARSAVQVECPGPSPWRIFVAIAPAQGGAATGAAAGRAATAVKRGDVITVVVRGRGFSIQQSAEAMESGAVGDWIVLRTSRKAESLRARIERPGLAVLPVS